MVCKKYNLWSLLSFCFTGLLIAHLFSTANVVPDTVIHEFLLPAKLTGKLSLELGD